MKQVKVEPQGITIEIDETQNLYEGLKSAGILLETPCGGFGVCGECGIRVEPPESVPPTPNKNISLQQEKNGLRLACQAVVKQDVTVHLTEKFTLNRPPEKGTEKIQLPGGAELSGQINPAVRVVKKRAGYFLEMKSLKERVPLENWHGGDTPLGLAVDLGTTTLVLCLVCLETGDILATEAGLNPQVAYGHDVLTRIRYAKNRLRRQEMATVVKNRLNDFIDAACHRIKTTPEQIVDVSIGANTTMLQLAAGIDSSSIGRTPFQYRIQGGCHHPASLFHLRTNRAAKVYLPPIMHAFVGTDISAGLPLCPGFFDPDQTVLFIDMGTNGEICLNAKGTWYAASTAAGPAFEGMGLSCGMRAKDGAIEKVYLCEGEIRFQTISDKPVKGVCGSGIVDFMAVLLESGKMDASGCLKGRDELHAFYADFDGMPAFKCGNGVYLTQKDIREIQLAKSAIRTGIDMILKYGGINGGGLDTIYLSGGFGFHLNPFHLEKIGLFPPGTAQKVVFSGNTSAGGARLLLTDYKQREYLEKNLKRMRYISLAELPGFSRYFVSNLEF